MSVHSGCETKHHCVLEATTPNMALTKHLLRFGATSSMKGLPRAVKADTKHFRLLWTVAFVGFLGVCFMQISLLIQNYFSYPTATNVHNRRVDLFQVVCFTLTRATFIRDVLSRQVNRSRQNVLARRFSCTFSISEQHPTRSHGVPLAPVDDGHDARRQQHLHAHDPRASTLPELLQGAERTPALSAQRRFHSSGALPIHR